MFVRIRPAPGTQEALTAESAGPVAAAGRDLSKIFLAAFAVGGIATTIKSFVTAATTHQAAFAVLDQTTKDAGASNELFGQSIETLLEKESRLKGFTDEDLASSFVRLVSATKNSEEAFKDLGLAEDVARARHIDLANAALAISKAEQGSATALQRLGIVVHPVTAAVDDLKTAHENAIISGAKFNDAQKEIYNQALLNAAVQDKEATRLQVLGTLQQRFGGDAAVFAQTASGQFARLQADFHQFEVSVGTGLLSGLASASEAVGAFFTRAENDQGLRQGISGGLNDIKDVAETVGPPLLEIAKDALAVAKAIGAPEIIAGVAAYKAFGIVQGAVASGQALYARAVAAGRGEVVAATSAQEKQTSAIAANATAIQAQATEATSAETRFAEAVAASTAAIDAQTAALERLAEAGTQVESVSQVSRLPLAGGVSTVAASPAAATVVATEAATPAVAQESAALVVDETATEGVTTATVAAAAAQATYTETLLAGAPALAEIAAGNTAVAGALAKVDAARATSIAASAEASGAAETEAAALARLTAADGVAAAAAIRLGLATQATAGYFAETATAAELAAVAEESAAGGGLLSGIGSLGLAAIGGAAGAAAIGVGVLAAGIYELVTAEDVGTEATHGLEHAVGDLNSAIHSDAVDKLTLAQARLTLRQDEAALSASNAAHNSVEYQQLLLNVANDSLRVSDAQDALKDSLATTTGDFEKQRQKVQQLIDADQILAQSATGANRRRGPAPADQPAQLQRIEATDFAEGIQQTIDTSKDLSPILLHNYQLLEQFAEVFGKVPPTKTWNLILNNKDATITLANIVREVDGLAPITAAAGAAAGAATINSFNQATLAGASQFDLGPAVSIPFSLLPQEIGPYATIVGQDLGGGLIGGIVSAVTQGGTAIANATAAAIALAQQSAAEALAKQQLNAQIDPLKQDVSGYQTDLANLAQQAQDTATQGAQALSQAIDQAKQNLNSIGQSIADSLFQYIDKPLQDAATRISDAQAKLSLLGDKQSLKNLGEEVILPGDKRLSSDPQKAVAQLEALQKTKNSPALDAYILQFRSLALQVEGDKNTVQTNAANLVKTAAESRLANLTDLFNTHRISQATLERDVTALLEHNGLTAKTARARGAAFADTLQGELTGLSQQASAINAVPTQAGSGLIPSITRPIDTLNATQKQLASDAAQQRTDQLNVSKDQTKILKDIHSSQKSVAATNSLLHNPAARAKRAAELVGTGR